MSLHPSLAAATAAVPVLAYHDQDSVVLVGAHVAGFDHLAGGYEALEAGGGLSAVGLVGFGCVDAPEAEPLVRLFRCVGDDGVAIYDALDLEG